MSEEFKMQEPEFVTSEGKDAHFDHKADKLLEAQLKGRMVDKSELPTDELDPEVLANAESARKEQE